LTSPVVRCLKLQTGAAIHYLTKKPFASILEANPYISKVYTIDKKVSEVKTALSKEKYDFIIDLHHNLRSLLVKWSMPFVKSYSFKKLNFEKWLMVNLKYDRLPKNHIVMRYLDSVKSLGVQYDGAGLDYFFTQKKSSFHDENLALITRKTYIAFAIGGAHFTKRLPIKKIISICKKIKKPIILLGGKGDATEGEKIELAIYNNREVFGSTLFNGCGKLTLDESAWVVQKAQKVITHDTGMMHIAAAFQKEIVSIWGNTIPEFGMYPFYKNDINANTTIQVEGLPCRPCSKIGFGKCPKGHFRCMEEIDEDAIAKAVND